MRICLVGKYPPIQGGVSAQTHWLAATLAARGHSVQVVTNADEVRHGFHQCLLEEDRERLSGGHGGNSVQVHNTTSVPVHSYLPWAPPFVTQLFGLTLSVVREFNCDIIFGWYFEPYGFVAAMVGAVTGRSVVLRHAGSDIGRLTQHPDLTRSYHWMLKQACAVLSGRQAREMLRALDVPEGRMVHVSASRLPDYFLRASPPLDLEKYTSLVPAWFGHYGLTESLLTQICELGTRPLEPGRLTIGVYGKIGETKGSYDLLSALRRLVTRGFPFNFLCIPCGTPQRIMEYVTALTEDKLLARRTRFLPPLPPWRIPAFLRCCDIVCFLERDFSIKIHRPVVPREILSSGACLVVSEEIASKQLFSQNLVDGKNVIVIPDPKDHKVLADRLGHLIQDASASKIIGTHGRLLSAWWEAELPPYPAVDWLEAFMAQR